MALLTNKLLNFNTLRAVRNKSHFSVPSLFWEQPLRRRRNLLDLQPEDLWRSPDPWELLFPSQHYLDHLRIPFYADIDKSITNTKDDFQVSLDVKHFAPNELNVKIVDNSIVVEAKHEERSDDDKDGYVSRHFTRRYVLPEEYSIKDVISTLSSDGILTVKAPRIAKEIDEQNVKHIEIQHTGPAHLNVSKPKDSPAEENKPAEGETPK